MIQVAKNQWKVLLTQKEKDSQLCFSEYLFNSFSSPKILLSFQPNQPTGWVHAPLLLHAVEWEVWRRLFWPIFIVVVASQKKNFLYCCCCEFHINGKGNLQSEESTFDIFAQRWEGERRKRSWVIYCANAEKRRFPFTDRNPFSSLANHLRFVRISLANSSSRSLSKWSASSNFIWQIYGECFSIKKSHFSSGRVRENRRVWESESEWKMLGKFLSTEILRESEEAEKRERRRRRRRSEKKT